ncbi:MAG: permease [Pseudomonadota bacterium]
MAVMVILAVAGGIGCYALGGVPKVEAAFTVSGLTLLQLAPRLIGAMLLAGFIQALVPRDAVARWLGAESGMRGLVLAGIAGAFTPGGPMASFPIMAAIAAAGADGGCLIAYLTAWSLLGINRIVVWDIPFLGLEFTALRMLLCLPFPILAGLLYRRLYGARPIAEIIDLGKPAPTKQTKPAE